MVKLEFINLEIYSKAPAISTEGCAQESSSKIVMWTAMKPEEKGKDIIVFKQNCSGISCVVRLDR